MKPSTETLKESLQQLITKYNEVVQIQATCKDQIIAVKAVIQDREFEDGDTENNSSTSSEN